MNLLMLSGNSLHNRDWIEKVSTQLPADIGARVIQYYRHWETGDEWINLAHEKQALTQQQLDRVEPYGVFAKSIGTVLALQAIDEGVIRPSFLLLLGIPLGYVQSEYPQFKDKLAELDIPITIIHNTKDTVGSSYDLKRYLGQIQHRLLEPKASGHDYEDYNLLNQELASLITQAS